MTYTADVDPLWYPGTEVLRNRAGITRQDDLDQFELSMFIIRSEEDWPPGVLDDAHYRALHRHLFQDVYDWAGETRRIRIERVATGSAFPSTSIAR